MSVATTIEQQVRRMTPVAAPAKQRGDVAAIARMLHSGECRLVGPSGEAISIPESVFYVLERVADVLASGDSITVVPVGQELTTQQAAGVLNVSRQYVVRLLDEGRIPFTKTGKHRRVRIEHVLAFKEQRDRERSTKLDELTCMSEDYGAYE